jgi:outer membrane protein assembly factor BamD
MRRIALVMLTVALGVTGCSTKKTLTADQYFREASGSFREGSYYLAVEQFHDLLDQFPFSQYSEEAELRIAHAQYLYGTFTEAIVAFNDFQRRHPTSPNLPFVGYSIGMCYAKQIGTIDRDQAAAQNAQNAFLKVIQQYPDSPYADLARVEVANCRRNLAEHELYIAKYYARHHKGKAAEIRLLTLATRYADTDAAADGLLRLAELYRRDKRDDHVALVYRALKQKHPSRAQAVVGRHDVEGLKQVSDPSEDEDPLDLLLAANGRQRGTGGTEIVQVPGLERSAAHRSGGGGPGTPGYAPPFDPFGRGRTH